MDNTTDLHIEEEILPLFDFTFNLFSGKAVRGLIMEPPGRMEEIMYRQQVLKVLLPTTRYGKNILFPALTYQRYTSSFKPLAKVIFLQKI